MSKRAVKMESLVKMEQLDDQLTIKEEVVGSSYDMDTYSSMLNCGERLVPYPGNTDGHMSLYEYMGIKEELVVENPPPNLNEDSKLNVNCCVPQCGISEKLDTEIIHVLGVTEATGTSWFMSMSENVETAPSTSDSDSDCQYSISTTCCVPSAHSEKNLSKISEPAVRSRKVANSGVGDMAATEASMTSVETSLRNISSGGPVVSNDDQSDTSGAPAWRTASPMNTAAVASTSSAVHKTAGSDAKRVWDRRNICPYCLVGQSKLSRHLERSHKTEADVVKAFVYPVGSAERKDANFYRTKAITTITWTF